MPKTIEFLYDFGSPNAYLAARVLPDIAERAGADIAWTPVLLGGVFKATGNVSPMQAFGHVKGKLEYEALERDRFIRRHGLDAFRFNPNFPVNTLMMMRIVVAAELQGLAQPCRDAFFKAMWEDGLKMDDPALIAEVLNRAGLDAAALMEGAQGQEAKSRLIANTEAAVARGVFGSPTFFVGADMFFGKERLDQVAEAAA